MALRDLILNTLTEEILNISLVILITASFIKKYFASKWLQTPYHCFCTLSISERFAYMLASMVQSELITEVFFHSCLASFQIISFNWEDGDCCTDIHFPVLFFISQSDSQNIHPFVYDRANAYILLAWFF